jgi:hypothetical protein
MNRSIKSVLALIILLCLGASTLGWTTRGIEGVANSQFWMRASALLLLPTVGLLVWAEFRRDRAPDFLRKVARGYFERDGFCFAVLPSVKDGRFEWLVLFQNRFERSCKALIAFRPATRFVGFGRAGVSDVRVEIECEGGGFGSATVPYGIPSSYQGKALRFELIAFSEFPGGKGRMLRFRDGVPVGNHHKSMADTAVTALSAVSLHPHFSESATFKVQLPANVNVEAVGDASQQILWRPGDPLPTVAVPTPGDTRGRTAP